MLGREGNVVDGVIVSDKDIESGDGASSFGGSGHGTGRKDTDASMLKE